MNYDLLIEMTASGFDNQEKKRGGGAVWENHPLCEGWRSNTAAAVGCRRCDAQTHAVCSPLAVQLCLGSTQSTILSAPSGDLTSPCILQDAARGENARPERPLKGVASLETSGSS